MKELYLKTGALYVRSENFDDRTISLWNRGVLRTIDELKETYKLGFSRVGGQHD